MIIQINATVCAAVDHGDDMWHEIAGSDQGRKMQTGRERGSDQGKQDIHKSGRNAGSCGRRQRDEAGAVIL